MEDRALVPLKDTLDLGNVLAQSGFFIDAKDASKAVVKVLAGRELGFGPIASMTGVSIIQGKPSINANLMAAAIKRTGKYNYRVITLTDEVAEIAFFEGGQEVGRSKFTMADAKQADLNGKDNWRKFPRNMLFARAMSNGARWYCPDIFGGVTPYTPEELGASVNGDGDVVDVQPIVRVEKSEPQPESAPESPKQNGKGWTAAETRDMLEKLLIRANEATAGHYKGTAHLFKTMQLERGKDFVWGNPHDEALWAGYLGTLVEHVQKEAGQKELPL